MSLKREHVTGNSAQTSILVTRRWKTAYPVESAPLKQRQEQARRGSDERSAADALAMTRLWLATTGSQWKRAPSAELGFETQSMMKQKRKMLHMKMTTELNRPSSGQRCRIAARTFQPPRRSTLK
jgi:hypothetical protein